MHLTNCDNGKGKPAVMNTVGQMTKPAQNELLDCMLDEWTNLLAAYYGVAQKIHKVKCDSLSTMSLLMLSFPTNTYGHKPLLIIWLLPIKWFYTIIEFCETFFLFYLQMLEIQCIWGLKITVNLQAYCTCTMTRIFECNFLLTRLWVRVIYWLIPGVTSSSGLLLPQWLIIPWPGTTWSSFV